MNWIHFGFYGDDDGGCLQQVVYVPSDTLVGRYVCVCECVCRVCRVCVCVCVSVCVCECVWV